jgi:hypothetical protein
VDNLSNVFTVGTAVLAAVAMVYFALQLPTRRAGAFVLFIMAAAVTIESIRIIVAQVIGFSNFAYGSIACDITRGMVFLGFLAINWIIIMRKPESGGD